MPSAWESSRLFTCSDNNSGKTMQAFIDDVTYSGQQTAVLPTLSVSCHAIPMLPKQARIMASSPSLATSTAALGGQLHDGYGTATNNSDYRRCSAR